MSAADLTQVRAKLVAYIGTAKNNGVRISIFGEYSNLYSDSVCLLGAVLLTERENLKGTDRGYFRNALVELLGLDYIDQLHSLEAGFCGWALSHVVRPDDRKFYDLGKDLAEVYAEERAPRG